MAAHLVLAQGVTSTLVVTYESGTARMLLPIPSSSGRSRPTSDSGVGGGVESGRLPGRARVGVQVGEACRFNGEQGDLVRAYVVRVTGRLAKSIVADDDVGAEVPDVSDETADDLVERSVDKPGPARRRLRVAGIVAAEQAWATGTQDGEGLGKFGSPAACGGPGGGDDRPAGPGRVMLGEDTAGQEALVVRVGEDGKQAGPHGDLHGGWSRYGCRVHDAMSTESCENV